MKSQNQLNARCHIQVAKALDLIGQTKAADVDRDLAYYYAHLVGMKNEPLSEEFKVEPFLMKAFRDGLEDIQFVEFLDFKKICCGLV